MQNDILKSKNNNLVSFFEQQKARYGELFWYQIDGNKIILMIEKIAEKARDILAKEETKEIKEIVSFETDDSIGEFYVVEADQIDVEQRPDKEEYKSIMDEDLNLAFTDITNDLYQNQLVRVFQPQGYHDFCLVTYHSFGLEAPRGPIGWLKNLKGLKKLDILNPEDYLRKSAFESAKISGFEEACRELEGVKYQIGGGSKKNGFDCSALVQKIFYETRGIWLPRKSRWQAMVCEKIELSDLKQGDLVFFHKKDDETKTIEHVALVYEIKLPTQSEQGRIIVFHATKSAGKALFEDLNQAGWLFSPANPGGTREINSFGRVRG